MPKIKEYTSQITPVGPSGGRAARAADFGGPALREAGQTLTRRFARDARTIINRRNQNIIRAEKTAVQATLSEVGLSLEERKKELELGHQRGDESFSETFLKEFDDTASKGADQFETRQGRDAYNLGIQQLRGQFIVESATIEAKISGQEARSNVERTVENNANRINSNPAVFQLLLDQSKDALNDPESESGRLPAIEREKLGRMVEQTYAQSAVEGTIRENPQLGQFELESGKWDKFLDKGQKDSLLSTAEVGIRGEEAAITKARKDEERADKKVRDEQYRGFVESFSKRELTPDMVTNSDLTGKEQMSLIKSINAQNKRGAEVVVDNPQIKELFRAQIFADDGDPNKLWDNTQLTNAYNDGFLSEKTYNKYMKHMEEAKTEGGRSVGKAADNFLADVKPQFTTIGFGFIKDTGVDLDHGQFEEYVDQRIGEKRDANENPHDLFTKGHKDYLGTPEVLNQWITPIQESSARAQRVMQSINNVNSPLQVPGMKTKGNIDLDNRVRIENPDGTFSTIESMSFFVQGEGEVLIPTIDPSGKRLNEKEAKARYMETGEHLGVFETPQEATRFAKNLSLMMGDMNRINKGATASGVRPIQAGESNSAYIKAIQKDQSLKQLRDREDNE